MTVSGLALSTVKARGSEGVEVLPDEKTLCVGEGVQFTAQACFDGVVRDVTVNAGIPEIHLPVGRDPAGGDFRQGFPAKICYHKGHRENPNHY
jgi:hypothetical protein